MKVISNTEFGGERPLFESHDLRLENVVIRAGESAIKECSNIEAVDCRFEGNYPFWHVHGFTIDRCFFDVGGRSALWYSDHLKMTNTRIDAPKMFREMHDIDIENVEMTDADEVFWRCSNIRAKDLHLHGGHLPFHAEPRHPHRRAGERQQVRVPIREEPGTAPRQDNDQRRTVGDGERDGVRLRSWTANTWAGTRATCGWCAAT